jgi:hypothetical protein
LISDDVVHLSIYISHIATERSENVLSSLVFKILSDFFIKAFHEFVEFIAGLVLFKDHWNVLEVVLINPEALRPAVRSKGAVLLTIKSDTKNVFSLS